MNERIHTFEETNSREKMERESEAKCFKYHFVHCVLIAYNLRASNRPFKVKTLACTHTFSCIDLLLAFQNINIYFAARWLSVGDLMYILNWHWLQKLRGKSSTTKTSQLRCHVCDFLLFRLVPHSYSIFRSVRVRLYQTTYSQFKLHHKSKISYIIVIIIDSAVDHLAMVWSGPAIGIVTCQTLLMQQ